MEQLALFDLAPSFSSPPSLPSPRRRSLPSLKRISPAGNPLGSANLSLLPLPPSLAPTEASPSVVPSPAKKNAQGRTFTAFGLTLSIWEWCATPYAAVDPPTLSRRISEYPAAPFERLLTTPAEFYRPDEPAERRFVACPPSLWSRVKKAAKRHRFNLQEFVKEGIDVAMLCGEDLPIHPLPSDPPLAVAVFVSDRSAKALVRHAALEERSEETCLLLVLAELATFGGQD